MQVFYGARKARHFERLAQLYADDYMLVRPDGSVWSKKRDGRAVGARVCAASEMMPMMGDDNK
jgi:hypothetical protein